MGMVDRDHTHCHTLLETLFSVCRDKAVELQFTVGEAISCVAAGQISTARLDPWDTMERDRYMYINFVQKMPFIAILYHIHGGWHW